MAGVYSIQVWASKGSVEVVTPALYMGRVAHINIGGFGKSHIPWCFSLCHICMILRIVFYIGDNVSMRCTSGARGLLWGGRN